MIHSRKPFLSIATVSSRKPFWSEEEEEEDHDGIRFKG